MNILGERWEHEERGDYDLDRFDKEFRDRLYSDKGREILRAQSQDLERQNNGMETIESLKSKLKTEAARNEDLRKEVLEGLATLAKQNVRVESLRQQLADSQARECAMWEALRSLRAEARGIHALLEADWTPVGRTNLNCLGRRVEEAEEALRSSTPAPCSHERRVRELEAELGRAKRAAKVLIHEHTERQKERDKALDDLTATRKRLAEFEEHERQTHEAMESIVGNRAEFVELTAELKQERDELREQLKTERERFDWLLAPVPSKSAGDMLAIGICGYWSPYHWRAEIDKARGK